MSLKERTINIDIMTKRYTKLKYKQGDSNQVLNFKLYKNGSELDLAGYVAGIFYEKPNNEVLEKSGTINSNTIRTTITSGVLNTAGVVKAEIFLTKNTEVSISFALLMEVEESINTSSAVQEQEQWDVIRDLLIAGDNTSLLDDSLTATNKTWSSSKIDSQISGLRNDVENIGKPTDEQVATIINQAIANGDIIAGGLTSTAQTLLISILRNAVFTSDQSASITLLQSELGKTNSGGSGGSGTTQYTISNNLSNATTSNSVLLVNANASYTTTITINDGYTLDTITVTMGGTDITSSAVSGTTITISAVTGNVVITVTTTASGGSSSGGMVTDGLENFFDFRTATYNNNGAGGSTIISATQGNGSLFTWATNQVTKQDDYGITIGRVLLYNGTSVGTTTTSIGTSFTVIFKCYLTTLASPLFTSDYGALNNINKLTYKPKYKTTSGTGNVTAVSLGSRSNKGYDTITLIVDDNICKLYFGTTLMQTNDGGTISDFQGWYDQLTGIGLLGSNTNGYLTQMAVYNKALSEVELVDMIDYLSSLEVK